MRRQQEAARSTWTARCARRGAGVLVVVGAMASAGCMIPSYHLPAGFSSSYHRQIYGMEPVPADTQAQGLAAIETRGGIFYPTTAFHDSAATSQRAESQKAVEPLLLDSDPLGSKKVTQRSNLIDY
jgi:hypothetical protein